MPERTQHFGIYGARGMKGSEVVGRVLDQLAGGIASPVDTERRLHARLRYLTASAEGYRAMGAVGIDVPPQTLMKWLAQEQNPRPANLALIDEAYRTLRRENVARHLLSGSTAGAARWWKSTLSTRAGCSGVTNAWRPFAS